MVEVDAHQVQRALANLVDNALKYSSPEERVRVHVTATTKETHVRVIDRGPGVPSDERERIFEPFERGSRSGDARGDGLGLAVARAFADANDGRISVESRPGQGAAFVLSLPLVCRPALL